MESLMEQAAAVDEVEATTLAWSSISATETDELPRLIEPPPTRVEKAEVVDIQVAEEGLKFSQQATMASSMGEEVVEESYVDEAGKDDIEMHDYMETLGHEKGLDGNDLGFVLDKLRPKSSTSVFLLSSAGKPIYASSFSFLLSSTSANDQELTSFTGLVQAIISVASDQEDGGNLQVLRASPNLQLVFQMFSPIYLLAISMNDEVPLPTLETLLQYMYHQILFILTSKGLEVLRKQPSYDLRDLLGGTTSVMDGLMDLATTKPDLFLQAYSCFPLNSFLRAEIANILVDSQVPNVLYGLILADSKIVSMVQPKNKAHALLVPDITLLINFVRHMTSLHSFESWTPLCLPNFNPSGFLYAYIVFLAQDICLILISTQQSSEQFHSMQGMKASVLLKLEAISGIQEIQRGMKSTITLKKWDVPLMHHFIYKAMLRCQYLMPESGELPYITLESQKQLMMRYQHLHYRLFPSSYAKKSTGNEDALFTSVAGATVLSKTSERWVYERSEVELLVCVNDSTHLHHHHTLYASFPSHTEVQVAVQACTRLLRYISQEEEGLFMMAPKYWTS